MDEEGGEQALTAVAKATADPRMSRLDHWVGMGGVYPRLMNKKYGECGRRPSGCRQARNYGIHKSIN